MNERMNVWTFPPTVGEKSGHWNQRFKSDQRRLHLVCWYCIAVTISLYPLETDRSLTFQFILLVSTGLVT